MKVESRAGRMALRGALVAGFVIGSAALAIATGVGALSLAGWIGLSASLAGGVGILMGMAVSAGSLIGLIVFIAGMGW